jgi:hypothetical protein
MERHGLQYFVNYTWRPVLSIRPSANSVHIQGARARIIVLLFSGRALDARWSRRQMEWISLQVRIRGIAKLVSDT